jgi:hypothetical protein
MGRNCAPGACRPLLQDGFVHGFEALAAGAKRGYSAVLIWTGPRHDGARGMKKVDRAQRAPAVNPAELDARFLNHLPGRVA